MIKTIFARCRYCYLSAECRIVQLTPDGKEWQEPMPVCDSCREYLRGHFRYAKAAKVGGEE